MNRHALIVGIDRYERLRPLRLPSADAEAIARLLGEQGGFKITRLPERITEDRTGVRVDPNAPVTEATLEAAIIRLFKPEGDQHPDVALLFVAGHGLQRNAGMPISYLAASDSDPAHQRWGLSLKWLRELLQASPVRNQIVWLDTCHSGGLLDFRQADPGHGTRCLIAASRGFEEAFEAIDGRHGVLTGALLQGLDPSRQPDGRVTNRTLAGSIDRLLRADTQHPLCDNSGEPMLLTWRVVEVTKPVLPTGRCPYKGLRYFDRHGEDPADFFGRTDLTDQLIERLRRESFLAVIGVSGSGKSSVVRAGLLHQLRLGERLGGSRDWPQVVMVPGSNPLASLQAALLRDQTKLDAAEAATLLTGSAATLAAIVRTLTDAPLPRGGLGGSGWGAVTNQLQEIPQNPELPGTSNRLVLLIDQFEELFTQVGPPALEVFLACLLGALDLAAGRFVLVVTLRADFYAKCAEQQYSGLARLIQDHQVIVQPMNPTELREAIVAPARRVGLDVHEDLVVQLLDEIRDAPGNLPLLQDTLTELWQQAHDCGPAGRPLTLSDYRASEGLSGTLRRRADGFFDQALDPDEQRAAQWILIQLTHLGEGTEDTSRRLPQVKLVNPRFDAELVARTIAKLASPEARLLVTSSLLSRSGEAQIATVEIVHETLIRHWPRLRKWLDKSREFQTWLRRLQPEAADWKAHDRDPDRLLRGLRLAEAVERRRDAEDLLDDTTTEFIEAGLALRERERREREEQQERERRLEEDRKEELRGAEEERRLADEQLRTKEAVARLFWTRVIAFVVGVGLIVALVLGRWVWTERNHARESEHARTESLFESRLTHAALLARKEDYAEARKVLRSTLELDPKIPEHRRHTRNLLAGFLDIMGGTADKVYEGAGAALPGGVAVSPNGRWLAAAGERGTLVVFDAHSGQPVTRLAGHDASAGKIGVVCAAIFSPSDGVLYSAGEDKRIIGWSVPLGQKLREWDAPAVVYALAISPDGKRLASGGPDKSVTLWSTETGGRITALEGDPGSIASPNGLAFSSEGDLVASASLDSKVLIWNAATFAYISGGTWHKGGMEGVAFSPDGKLLATSGDDKRIALWDLNVENPGLPRELTGHDNIVFGVLVFDAGSRRLLSTSRDMTMRLWDLRSGVTLRVYQGHTAGVWNVARDGDSLYTASDDQTVRRWSADTPGQRIWDIPPGAISAAVAPDGTFVAVGFADGALRTYALPDAALTSAPPGPPVTGISEDAASPEGQPMIEFAGAHAGGGVKAIGINADGKTLATAGDDGTLKLWRVERSASGLDLALVHSLENHMLIGFSQDGLTLAIVGPDGKPRLFDAPAGQWDKVTTENFASLEVPEAQVVEREPFRYWIENRKRLLSQVKSARDAMFVMTSPNGRQAAVVGRGAAKVALYDLGPGGAQPRYLAGHEDTVHRAIYSPDEHQLATVGADRTYRIWDLDTDKELFSQRLPASIVESKGPWDFDFRCSQARDCWIAVPLPIGRLALYHLPYREPPESLRQHPPH